VHGTFCGNDLLGLWTEVARFAPGLSERLRRLTKGAMNVLMGEAGNYTRGHAQRLQDGLSAGAGRTIPVQLFNWPSQNNHISRADGAVRLIDELTTAASQLPATEPKSRILIWSHSHGGNVLALATNLLGGDEHSRREFFHAARSFYRRGPSSAADFPAWERVEDLLAAKSNPLEHVALDLVTFGTPIRYGWDAGGYSKLLHVHNHKPPRHHRHWLAAHPPRFGRLLVGGDGDFVQRIGVAGSGFPPIPLAMRTFIANSRLKRLVARGAPAWLLRNLKAASRVPDEGSSLLIDYAEPGWFPLQHVFGHVLYTRSRWLPLHCELVAEEFYRDAAGGKS
jgi:hypothetical protein